MDLGRVERFRSEHRSFYCQLKKDTPWFVVKKHGLTFLIIYVYSTTKKNICSLITKKVGLPFKSK
ncbi:hypothetical protein QA786_15095, partial [Listeria monocytogenes]|uniref:hypothetical protein n=1 Tax=Listeria monocytogenes TaxID=1639 RepID=UPI0024971F41